MYKIMTIETNYSSERFLYDYNEQENSSEEVQASYFLNEHCFCDEYKISHIRDATKKETQIMTMLLFGGINFWDAQGLVCYPKCNNLDGVFNFGIINTADGSEIIDRNIKTPYSALTVVQLLEYLEINKVLLCAK